MPVPAFIMSIGAVTALSPCTPGADLWATPAAGGQGFIAWYYAGVCPEAGQVVCGNAILANSNSLTQYFNGAFYMGHADNASCFQDVRVVGVAPGGGGGGGGGEVTGELTLAPFEYTTEQQAEIYQSLAVVFGVFLGVLALAWGLKAIIRLLGFHGNSAD